MSKGLPQQAVQTNSDRPDSVGGVQRTSALGLIGLLVAALGLAALSAAYTWQAVRGLPLMAVLVRDSKDLNERVEQAIRNASPGVREAYTLRYNSYRFTEAWRKNSDGYALERDIASTPEGAQSQLRRVQLLAARFLALEQRGQVLNSAWAELKPLLDDALAAKSFSHLQPVLISSWANAFQSAGIREGTARALASDWALHPHGAVAEYVAPRLQELGAAREAAGDSEGAAACRKLLLRWLRDWLQDAASIGERLIAADLLSSGTAPDRVVNPEMAAALRGWRKEYHAQAGAIASLPLGVGQGAQVSHSQHRALLGRTVTALWICAAAVGGLLAGLVGLPLALFGRGKPIRLVPMLAAGGLLGMFAAAGATNLSGWLTQLGGDWSSLRNSWWFLYVAVGSGALLTWVTAVIINRRGGSAGAGRRAAVLGAGMTLLLGSATLILSSSICSQEGTLDGAVKTALDDPAAAIGAPLSPDLLAQLRALTP